MFCHVKTFLAYTPRWRAPAALNILDIVVVGVAAVRVPHAACYPGGQNREDTQQQLAVCHSLHAALLQVSSRNVGEAA